MMIETALSRSLRLMFASGAALMLAQPAFAQDNAPIQRVEITGSAIKRIDAETAVPVTVVKMDDLKKEGITTIEQVMANLSVAQASQGTSQSVGSSTGGAAFADLRGIGQNKTLVLLNGRRLGNNAFDSSAPDLNMIPFAALERVEVLRDGASSLYGSDAVGGVINFITKKDYQGGTITLGADSPQHAGGSANNFNAGYGWGDLDKNGFNIFAVVDHQEQHRISGTQRDYNRRFFGGLSSSPYPANWSQGSNASGNPAAPDCTAGDNLVPGNATTCYMSTSPYVDYVPKSERTTGLIRGTFKINENHELGVELLSTQSKVQTAIAPVPYGNLYVNSTRTDGSANPYFPSAAGIDPTYMTEAGSLVDGLKPGYVVAKWRDLPNGSRRDENINKQNRLVVSLKGVVAGWDYEGAVTYNENKVRENLFGYSNGDIISAGVMNGIINPFGAQDAAGTALLNSAALNGNIMNAKGTNKGADLKFSREVGDWFSTGHQAGLAVGAQYEHQDFRMAANTDFAAKVVASTGIDPDTLNSGSRNVSAFFSELNVPVLKNLDVTAAVRYDKYSDFGHTANPKFSFNYRPTGDLLVRGSFSKGFRAPSLYDLYAGNAYTNGASTLNDPVNCPGGTAAPGKPANANCSQQFQVLTGGSTNLSPERSKNATFGVMWEPIKNLSVGADFWSIRLTNQIGTLTDSDVLAHPELFASHIIRNASGDLATDGSLCPNPLTCGYLDLRTQNLGDVNTNGIDLSANYRLRTKDYGSFTFSDNATWVHKYEYQNFAGDEMHQRVGVYSGDGPIFRWQNTLNVNWSKGKYGAGLTGHYKSGYQDYNGEDAEVADHRVASYTTWDTYGSYEAMQNLTLTAGVRNLFDRNPPLSYQTSNFQVGYDPRYTDPTGRTFYVRATYNF
ncbi:TonB-dependent receptor [Duganella sp. FT80W]|uniref:TonB-dependent receptor n=1 Tax=Duganella guangzhouensis TaxID=2666084 RepID=A0A6I2KZN2_9BURK|nr:TonB-dependent receptor [Duganella guangzhouensis]MRW91368.1 TonB-dependent receptor [Duganella guangzhouensis]